MDAGGVILMASSDNVNAATAYFCSKPRMECGSPKISELQELPLEGVKGQRRQFLSKAKIAIAGQQEFSVIMADKSGNFIGSRSFKMVDR
jgi:hypothetical protein